MKSTIEPAKDGGVNIRGFRVFVEDLGVRVAESSAAGRGAHAWIFSDTEVEGRRAVHLSVDQANAVICGLVRFVQEARAGKLTEPAPKASRKRGGK